mgnify:CR=1 FL=1
MGKCVLNLQRSRFQTILYTHLASRSTSRLGPDIVDSSFQFLGIVLFFVKNERIIGILQKDQVMSIGF